MYDSRTDRPNYPGTHHNGHAFRHDAVEPGKGDIIEWGTPKARRLATRAATHAAIAEGLAEMAEDAPEYGPGLKRLGAIDYAHRYSWIDADGRVHIPAHAEDDFEDACGAYEPLVAQIEPDERALRRENVIAHVGLTRKRRAAKRAFSRIAAPRFDPALVSRTLSPSA